MGRRWAIRTLNFKEVSYENGNFHNHCSDNLELNSKDNSEYAVLCSLLRGSPDFFSFLALHGNNMRSAITTLKLKEVSTVNGMFPELQTALSIFQKQVAIAGNGFPLTLFQDLFSTFVPFRTIVCRLTPNGCTVPMGTSYESGASTERGEAASRCAWWSCVL